MAIRQNDVAARLNRIERMLVAIAGGMYALDGVTPEIARERAKAIARAIHAEHEAVLETRTESWAA